jgi:hypothetical protein
MRQKIESRAYYGVNPELIDAAIARGRRERSEAVWAMLQMVFGRKAEPDAASRAEPPVATMACPNCG